MKTSVMLWIWLKYAIMNYFMLGLLEDREEDKTLLGKVEYVEASAQIK